MTLYLKWKDKRYENNYKWNTKTIKDEEWKEKEETFKMLWINKGEETAKEYLKNQFTTSKNRKNLLAIEAEYEKIKENKTEKSYWNTHFEE